MEIEKSLKEKEKPKLTNKIEFQSLAVRTIFLEDLVKIHRNLEIIAKPAQEFYDRQIEHNFEMNELIKRESSHIAKNLPSRPLSPRWTSPPIKINNEEFEFKDLDEVSGIQREGFSEYGIRITFERFFLQIGRSITLMELQDPTMESSAAFHKIETVLRKRENRTLRWIDAHGIPVWWFLALIGLGILILVDRSRIFDAAFTAVLSAGVFSAIWYFGFWRRRFVVIPQFAKDVAKPLLSAELILGFITFLSLVVAAVTWLFPRN